MKSLIFSSQISKDAVEFAKDYTPQRLKRQEEIDYSIAFAAGAKQLMIYLRDWSRRVNLELQGGNEFERGQADGANWAYEAMQMILGGADETTGENDRERAERISKSF